jgi:hypothetical protein
MDASNEMIEIMLLATFSSHGACHDINKVRHFNCDCQFLPAKSVLRHIQGIAPY